MVQVKLTVSMLSLRDLVGSERKTKFISKRWTTQIARDKESSQTIHFHLLLYEIAAAVCTRIKYKIYDFEIWMSWYVSKIAGRFKTMERGTNLS